MQLANYEMNRAIGMSLLEYYVVTNNNATVGILHYIA